jgi:hypothetical protein
LGEGKGNKWKLKYSGPGDTEQIGKDWLPFSYSGFNDWRIINGKIRKWQLQ